MHSLPALDESLRYTPHHKYALCKMHADAAALSLLNATSPICSSIVDIQCTYFLLPPMSAGAFFESSRNVCVV